MTGNLDTAVVCALLGLVSGWFVPSLIAGLPEPEPDPEEEAGKYPPKEPYVDLAARPGLGWKCAVACAVAAGLIGLVEGWAWPLTWLVFLCPIGVALAVVDFRTWYLPARLMVPAYVGLVSLILLAFVFTRDVDDVVRAAIAWALTGSFFLLLWFFTPGMAYGDVRLAGVIGPALGYLGWGEPLLGVYAGFVLGGLAWLPLRLTGRTTSRFYPFGPFMLVGALAGVIWGDDLWGYLAARWT